MVKPFYFSTLLLFVSIDIFLLATMTTKNFKKQNRKRQLQRQRNSSRLRRHRYKTTSPVQAIDTDEETHQDQTDIVPVQGPDQDVNSVEEIHVAYQNYDALNVKVHVPESAHKIGFRFDKKKGTTGNIWLAGIAPGTPADKINNWRETIMYATVLKYNNEDITCIDDILCISCQILESKPITFDIEFCIVKKGDKGDDFTVPVQAAVKGINSVEEVHTAVTDTVPVWAVVQGINLVEEVHTVKSDTNNNPHPDLVPSLCQFIDRKKHYKQH